MPLNKILLKNIVQDKIDELKQSTVDSAARKRTAQLRDPNFKGEEVPIYKAGTKEIIGTRRKPGKGVIQIRLQGRKESPGKPAKKPLYKKITPGATGRAARQDASHQPVYDRMAEMLIERRLNEFIDPITGGILAGGAAGLARGAYRLARGVKHGYTGDTKEGKRDYGRKRPITYSVGTGIGKAIKGLIGMKRKMKGQVSPTSGKIRDPKQILAKNAVRQPVRQAAKQSEIDKQEAERQKQEAEKQKQAQLDREYPVKRAKTRDEIKSALAKHIENEKARKLVNYESTSYRNVMLRRIAEMRLLERGVPQERIDEVFPLVPLLWTAARVAAPHVARWGVRQLGRMATSSGGRLAGETLKTFGKEGLNAGKQILKYGAQGAKKGYRLGKKGALGKEGADSFFGGDDDSKSYSYQPPEEKAKEKPSKSNDELGYSKPRAYTTDKGYQKPRG